MSQSAVRASAAVPDRHSASSGAILLFDGVCTLCNRAVQFVIDRDPDAYFRFAALQSPVGQQLLEQHGLPRDALETMVLIEEGRCYIRSDAALRVARHLSGWWPLLRFLTFVPRSLRDWAYNQLATHRYQWFGKRDTCMVPTPELRQRFLQQ